MGKTNNIIIALALFASNSTNAFAQVSGPIKALTIGSQCPDLELGNMINYQVKNIHLSAFKGKIVVIDFWATWCGSCIEALPKLDKMQKEFPGDIVILPVTYENTDLAESFWKKNSNLNVLNLPSVTRDTTLTRLFPHRMIPHEVWLDRNGKVVAITGTEDVNEQNLKNAIQFGTIALKIKQDILEKNYLRPLYSGYFGDYKPDPGLIQYQSLLTKFIDGAPSIDAVNVISNGLVKRTITNCSITGLFQTAVLTRDYLVNYKGDFSEKLSSRIRLEVRDSSRFDWPAQPLEAWLKKPDSLKLFSYEQIIPFADSVKLNDYMLEDLNRYFGRMLGIEAVVAKRRVKCWALVRTTATDLLRSKGGKPQMELGPNNDFVKVQNETVRRWLIRMLMYPMNQTPLPVVNESGYNDPIDMEIHADLTDPRSVGTALQKYGLDFKLVERDLDMLVIRDKKQ